jgi:CheY-like chemotaxis protein
MTEMRFKSALFFRSPQGADQKQKRYIGEFLERLRDRFWFKVLVVEDSPDSRNLLRLAMDTLPCEIEYAEDGTKARELLEQKKDYDLLIVDQDLPDIQGLKLLESVERKRQMRNDSRKPIPFIVYSGIDLRPMGNFNQFKFADFIRKPTNIVAIHDRIEKVLKTQCRQAGVGQNL